MWINFVNAIDPEMASFRYRALWPSKAICEQGEKCLITNDPSRVKFTKSVHGIVFTKSFNEQSIKIAWQAHKSEVPIILDLCDNIFVPDYLNSHKGLMMVMCFKAMAEMAQAIIVPTQALKAVVQKELDCKIPPVHVVADCVESKEDVQRLINVLAKADSSTQNIKLASSLMAARKHGRPTTSKNKTKKAAAIAKALAAAKSENGSVHGWRQPRRMLADTMQKFRRVRKRSIRQKLSIIASAVGLSRRSPKTVLWFGNAGELHGDYGISTILRFAQALEAASEIVDMELLVVSNNVDKYCEYIAPLPFPSRYAEWSPISVFEQIAAADVVILPNSNDPFSFTKSANRVVLSLSCGTPVITEDFDSLDSLRDCVVVDDINRGLHRYLIEDNAAADLSKAQIILDRDYSSFAVGRQLTQVYAEVNALDVRSTPLSICVLLHPVDAEVLRPIMNFCQNTDTRRIKILLARTLSARDPELRALLEENGFTVLMFDKENLNASASAELMSCEHIYFSDQHLSSDDPVRERLKTLAGKVKADAKAFSDQEHSSLYVKQMQDLARQSSRAFIPGHLEPASNDTTNVELAVS